MSILEKIVNLFTKGKVPPVVGGAKAMIQQISAQERRITKMNATSPIRTYSMIREKENIADLFSHCVSKDFYKDAYQFIKTA